MRKWLAFLCLALIGLLGVVPAAPAYAHGEKSQESFLRTRTISWVDVKFSKNEVQQGETVVVTGSFFLHNNFPEGVQPPIAPRGKAYLNVLSAGPAMLVKERSVGGLQQTQTITLELGKLYDFKVVVIGRREGRWHVHPVVAVKLSGALIGPGEFIEIKPNPDGFANNVQLANGSSVNLENFGFWGVVWWQILLIVLGAVWLALWLIPSPIIARAAPVGQGFGDRLITRGQKRASVVFMALVFVVALLGIIVARVNNPDTIPVQIRRDYPPASANFSPLVQASRVGSVTYDKPNTTMKLDVNVKNISDRPIHLRYFNVANVTWDNTAVVPGKLGAFHYPMQVSPGDGEIAPGETAQLNLVMADEAWEFQRLISTSEVSSRIGGVLYFSDGQGGRQVWEVDAEILPAAGTGVVR